MLSSNLELMLVISRKKTCQLVEKSSNIKRVENAIKKSLSPHKKAATGLFRRYLTALMKPKRREAINLYPSVFHPGSYHTIV